MKNESYHDILSELQNVYDNKIGNSQAQDNIIKWKTEANKLFKRIIKVILSSFPHRSYEKTVFRGVRSKYANSPISWRGTLYSDIGRFHKGQASLYLSESQHTVTKEIPDDIFLGNQVNISPVYVKLSKIFDIPESEMPALLIDLLIKEEPETCIDVYNTEPYTHILSDFLRDKGYEGIRYESSRAKGEFNLVVFPKNIRKDSFIELVSPQKNQDPTRIDINNINHLLNKIV
jgi:predicted transcriptional regulator with HTH domain